MAVAVEEYISPKDWACKRQKYKHNSRRDCHKSCSSGATLRKTIIPKREDYVETRNTLGAPNPIERYFNRLNPSAAKVKENLSDIILKTNPNEIIYTPRYKSDRLTDFCDDVLQYRINLIYKYTKEQYNEAMLWRSRFLSKKKKEFDPDFDQHSNNFIKNNNNNKKNKDWEGKKNAYVAPIINEPAIGLGKGNKKSKVFHTPDSTPKNPKCDFILIDFGCNKWLTGFSTTYHWGKEKQLYRSSRNNTDPKDEPKLKLLSCVNNYTIDIAYDEQELESNLQKLRSSKKYDNDEDKTQSKRLTKRERSKNNSIIKQTHSKRGKLNKNGNKMSNDEYLEKLNLNWDRVGTYNGNLDGYYVNLNKEFRVEKTHRVGNDQSRQSSKNGYKNGRLCRYIKITPLNHETGFNFIPYGLKVDLSGKPIVQSLNKRVRNNSNNNDKEINNTEDCKEDMNSNVDNGAEMNDIEFESYLNQIVRVGERSKIIDENENDSDDDNGMDGNGNNNDRSCIVRISITEEGPNLKYSSMEGLSECYGHWGYNYNFDNIRSKRQEDKRYFNYIRKLERSSCKLVE